MAEISRFEQVKRSVRCLFEVSAWPHMIELIDRAVHRESQSVWDYSFAACEAVGGDAEAAVPGAAAIFCSLASIHLVDDMLDEDPYGVYRRIGAGNAANVALAFQAAAHRLLLDATADVTARADLQTSLAGMALATAFGQSLDARPVTSEAEYWRVVEAKTPPLFGAALYIGARLGGARQAVAAQLEELGGLMGRFIQISDDLKDALETPAQADWQRPTNNLALLYALTTAHPEQERFAALVSQVDAPQALAEAQHILVDCGAVSYCAAKLAELSGQTRTLLARIPLAARLPIEKLLDSQARPLCWLFQQVGFHLEEAHATG